MAALHRSVAALRISGQALDPGEVTSVLGGRPTYSHRMGDELHKRPEAPSRLAPTGVWKREATPTEPGNLNAQVLELLSGLTTDMDTWQQLCSRFRIDIFCGWFMDEGNEGVEISPDTLRQLGERGIALSLDIYGPDFDA